MNKLKILAAALFVMVLFSSAAYCEITWTDTSDMTLFLAKHYDVDPIVVVSLGQRMSKYDDDVSTALFIASLAKVDPMDLLNPRIEGKSWGQIMKNLSVDSQLLFTPVKGNVLPGKFRYEYNQYTKKKNNPKYEIVLYDDNIRNLVQLKLMTTAFGKNPLAVMKQVSQGYSFTDLLNLEFSASGNSEKTTKTTEE